MSKGIPTNYEEWLREVQQAYLAAKNKVAETDTEIEDIFCYAAELAAEKRGIVDGNVTAQMNELVTEMVHEDYATDDRSRSRYKFHFVSGYVFAHVEAGLIDEKEGDWILGYINDEWDLFNET